jgi:electron transport complex protein RnfB
LAHAVGATCIGCGACTRICPVLAVSGEMKQCHVIDPRRCLDCGACGRVCAVGAVQDGSGNPLEQQPRDRWPKPAIDAKVCLSCGLCLASCPVAALDWGISTARRRHLPASLAKPEACLACGFCRAICPVGAVTIGGE